MAAATASTSNIKTPWIETPLIRSHNLSRIAGCNIFLKLENLQPSGSFKSRGIGQFMLSQLSSSSSSSSSSSPPPHFFISSGGNAGLACVHAARDLNSKATVVVPLSTKPHMVEKLRQAGATRVIQRGESWKEADDFLRNVAMPEAEAEAEENGVVVYVHPFDHSEVWKGNSGIVDEVRKQIPPPVAGEEGKKKKGKIDAIICSVGGGGLFSGIMQGLLEEEEEGGKEEEEEEQRTTKVIAMETKGADSFSQALEAGELVTLPGITSIATSLGARTVCEKAFEYGMMCGGGGRGGPEKGKEKEKVVVRSVVLSDEEAMMGCKRFADEERFMVEAACGVCPALVYTGGLEKAMMGMGGEDEKLREDSNVVIVVCGGSNVSLDILRGEGV